MGIMTPSQLTIYQEEQIPLYIEKWRDKSLLTTAIAPPLFEQGLQDIHEELRMEPPCEFLYYRSPFAMWREFEVWKPGITRVLTQFWRYQIPLCDPSSMHRLWPPGNKRSAFNFAAKRYSPGPNLALLESSGSDETFGTLITKELHEYLWKRFDFQAPFNWNLLGYSACGDDEPPGDYLLERADEEDPTNQIPYQEYCFLSPSRWLLRELACVDFCRHVLGISRNERLYAGLEAIVEHGSFCGVFGRLCVACERPCKIEIANNSYRLVFTDGEVFTNPDLVKLLIG